mgnify:CR=1 FL=1
MSLYIGDASDAAKQIMHLTGAVVAEPSLATTAKVPSTIYHSIDSDFPFVIFQETVTLGAYASGLAQYTCRYTDDWYTYHYRPFSASATLLGYLAGGYHILAEVTVSGVKSYSKVSTEIGLTVSGYSVAGIANGTSNATYIIDSRLNKVVVPKYSSSTEASTSTVSNMTSIRFLVFDYRSTYTSDAVVGYTNALTLGCTIDRNDIIVSSKNIDLVPYLMLADTTQVSSVFDTVVATSGTKSLIVTNVDGNSADSLLIDSSSITKKLAGVTHPYMNSLKKPLRFVAIQSVTISAGTHPASVTFGNLTNAAGSVYLIHQVLSSAWKELAVFAPSIPYIFAYAQYSQELCTGPYTQYWRLEDVSGVIKAVNHGGTATYVAALTITVSQFI